MAPPSAHRFPGWRVVTAAFVVLAVSSGFGFYGLAVYLNAFKKERGWEIAAISLATTVFFFVGGVVGLLVARLIARRDARHVVVGGGLIGAVALALLGRVTHEWQLFVVYGVWAFGWSASGLVPLTTVITRWYHAKRSTALSVASTGLSVGGIVITPAAKWLLDEYGLRAVTPWLALAWLVGIVPIAWWMLLPDPAPLGWHPDGERVEPGHAPRVLAGVVYAEAVRHRFFLAVTGGYLLLMGSQVGGIQQLVRLTEERAGARTATLATSVLAATSVVARLAGGQIARKVAIAPMTVGLGVAQCISLVALSQVRSSVALFAATILFGATVGNILMLQPLLIAERFGVLDYPRIYSRSQFLTMFGTAGGPLLLGWLHDVAGGYDTSYLVAGACALVGAAVVAAGGPAVAVTAAPVEAAVAANGENHRVIPEPLAPSRQGHPTRRRATHERRSMPERHPNVDRVVAAAAEIGLAIEPRSFPEGTKTAADAAAAIGVELGQIVKSLIFAVDGEVVLAYVSGANQLDERRLAAAAGGTRCSRVDADTVRRATGFPIGGVPPFGHATHLRVFIDPDLLQYDEVWAAAGTWHDVFGIEPHKLVEASEGVITDLKRG